ncbi:coiled-coil domain-containing protein 125 [Monodelphis domestica]|nr:coiled-coil domain-containing protein 125 [Monodelphis domestica]XP_056680919.1 coiled-coil domain-containing protein 125 [Monodelphis domestica]XP_056680920.1 coiled-coil domain-containing protein 125 [Monodelphis domestica]XP_056680921.1 coiled-coil domain-containing protein 125 [Monodelphis domestica]
MSVVVEFPSELEEDTFGGEDDMTDGDLGNGLGRKPGGIYEMENSNAPNSRKGSFPSSPEKREDINNIICPYFKHRNSHSTFPQKHGFASCKRQSDFSDSELSNEQVRQQLHEALQEVEVLRIELEASQKQLEGKREALKILQNMAIFGKATRHTKEILQKSEEQKKSLEKEINTLQWEIEFDHDRFKTIEESWAQKYDRIYCENSILKETLKLRTEEVKRLKSENATLNQQCLETIAMLDIRQQKLIQESMCLKSGSTEVTGLELAVLGACVCNHPGGQPCSCSKTAAMARKQLLQLKQELDLLKKSKEEAYIMADAFRIAFEQQLMRRNEETLKLMQVNKICKKSTKWLNWKHPKDDGFVSQKKNFGQKLMDILTSEANSKRKEELDNHQEIFRILIDLLNDKEEALAHQRKVSYMLARELEDKDAIKKSKDQEPVKADSPCENHSPPTSDPPRFFDPPICSDFHILSRRNCICSVLNHNIDATSVGTLKKSRSLPSRVRFFEEIQVEETYKITTGSSL